MEFNPDRNALLDSDLEGIKDIMRIHIEIRNRSFMKRVCAMYCVLYAMYCVMCTTVPVHHTSTINHYALLTLHL